MKHEVLCHARNLYRAQVGWQKEKLSDQFYIRWSRKAWEVFFFFKKKNVYSPGIKGKKQFWGAVGFQAQKQWKHLGALGELKLVQYGRRRKKKKMLRVRWGQMQKASGSWPKDLGLSCRQKGSCWNDWREDPDKSQRQGQARKPLSEDLTQLNSKAALCSGLQLMPLEVNTAVTSTW